MGLLLTALVNLGCVLVLLWLGRVGWEIVQDNHRRGMARVQQGQSWTPKVPTQRGRL